MPAATAVRIPFHLGLSDSTSVEADLDFKIEEILSPGHYDPASQMWLGEDGLPRDIRAGGSKTTSPGICGTDVFGIIESDRDQVQDD